MTGLRPYQHDGIRFLTDHPRALLGDDAGLGKSVQMIRAAQGDTLVVAPAMVLDGGTWDEEYAKWGDPGVATITAYTSLNQRVKTDRVTKTGNPIYETLDSPKPEYRQPWGTVILDEAHYIKGRKTTWTAALRTITKRADRVYLATGTPIPNWAHELFTLLQMLHPDQAERGGKYGSYWRWAEQWFDTRPTRFSQGKPSVGDLLACGRACQDRPAHDPCDHYLEFASANLGDQYLRRLRDDVLPDLPPLSEQHIDCPMVPAQAKAYRQLKKQFLTEVEGTEIVAWTPSALNVKLAKCVTGLEVLAGPPAKGSGKLARLAYDLAGRSYPTTVFAHFQDSVEAAYEVAKGVGHRAAFIHGGTSQPARKQIIHQFKSGQIDTLCGSLETLAEGLTLVQADMTIFLEKSYKPSRNEQAIRRVHRLGQTRPVTVLTYVTPGTIDERKEILLATKTDRQMRVLSAAQYASLL